MSKNKLGRGLSDLGLSELLSSINKNQQQPITQSTPTAIQTSANRTNANRATANRATAAQRAASRLPTPKQELAASVSGSSASVGGKAGADDVGNNIGNNATIATATTTLPHGLRTIDVELLHPSKYQPRQAIDPASLDDLAASIKAQGVIQPILVRLHPRTKGEYEIIAGERRWRAAQLAGFSAVPTIVREISDEQAAAMALIENLQREDLNAIDVAQGLQRLLTEFGMTHQAIATAVGKSRATVTNLLRILALPASVKAMVQHAALEMGHARALLALPLQQQVAAAKHVAVRGLSVRATEEFVQKLLRQQAVTAATAAGAAGDASDNGNGVEFAGWLGSAQQSAQQQRFADPNVTRLQQRLSEVLGAKIALKYGEKGKNKGKGKLIVYYNSLDELDGIVARIAPGVQDTGKGD